MAAGTHVTLDVNLRNEWIRSPLNPTGEIHSLLDSTKNLSYDRWSVSIVCSGTAKGAYCRETNKNTSTTPSEHATTAITRCMALLGHGRIVLEKVTRIRGYELIDADATASRSHQLEGLRVAVFRKYINSQTTLANITSSIGPLIKAHHKVQAMIDFIEEKRGEAWDATEKLSRGEPVTNPPMFNLFNPNPAANVFNCITFSLQAAKAGDVDLYPLLGERIIPRRDIRDIEKLASKAIDEGLPLEPEIKEYIENVETEGTINLRKLTVSLNNLVVLMSEGPCVFKEYKRLLKDQELSGEKTHNDLIEGAKKIVYENGTRTAGNEAARAITYTPLLCVIPVAMVVESCYESSVKKKRNKTALAQFFNQE